MIVGATTATTLYVRLRAFTVARIGFVPRVLTILLIMFSVLRDGCEYHKYNVCIYESHSPVMRTSDRLYITCTRRYPSSQTKLKSTRLMIDECCERPRGLRVMAVRSEDVRHTR